MKSPSVFSGRSRELEVAMTPMIDVVFMLLIFFVWTSSFRVAELLLPSSIVTQSSQQGSESIDVDLLDLERVVVRIDWNAGQPRWRINDVEANSLAEVSSRLAAVAAVRDDLPVLVDPQPDVPLGDVIDVYDLALVQGFEQVQFATQPAR